MSQLDWLEHGPRTSRAAMHLTATMPLARASDPSSSHVAADKQTRSGRAAGDRDRAYAALKAFPLSTCAELAQASQLDYHMLGKRLPDLVKLGKVRQIRPTPDMQPCAVLRAKVCRWEPL